MITLKDYNLLYSNNLNDPLVKKNVHMRSDFPFYYLYPSDIQPGQKNVFINQKERSFTVTCLEDFQQCQKIIELINSETKIFVPSQQFFVVQHKNPHSEKRLLVVSSIQSENSLHNIAQNCFFQNSKVPDEDLCANLIERMLLFLKILEQKGITLKIITPQHILIYEGQIYIYFPFPHDLNDDSSKVFEQLYKNQIFCAPQILKVINNSRNSKKEAADNTNSSSIVLNQVSLETSNLQVKCFKKSILYSMGLCILYSFGHTIPMQDRYNALRNPRYLNNHIDQLRKEVKTHHDGKYISKLLKLMLEHSESLRDTIKTFTYKMNSVQFMLLKKFIVRNELTWREENIPTQSQINSHPMLRTTSGKKTIDIRISSMSNASSLISKSWLSVSHPNIQKMLSPSDTNKQISDEKDKEKQKSGLKSKKQLTPIDLNQIHQEHNGPPSPIEFDIQWDQDGSIRESNKSNKSNKSNLSSKQNSRSSSDKEKKDQRPVLLNKISEKEEAEDQQGKQNDRKIGSDPTQQQISFESIENKQNNQEARPIEENKSISKTEKGVKNSKHIKKLIDEDFDGAQNRISESDNRAKKKYPNKQSKIQSQVIVKQKDEVATKEKKVGVQKEKKIEELQSQKEREINNVQFKLFEPLVVEQILPKSRNQPIPSQQTEPHQPSSMNLFQDHQPDPLDIQHQTQLNQSMTLELPLGQQNNESLIFEQPFDDEEEYKKEQELLKQSKTKEKDKLTERKKDQYNERSKVILVTLVAIFAVFQFVQWLLERQRKS